VEYLFVKKTNPRLWGTVQVARAGNLDPGSANTPAWAQDSTPLCLRGVTCQMTKKERWSQFLNDNFLKRGAYFRAFGASRRIDVAYWISHLEKRTTHGGKTTAVSNTATLVVER
jgi:hypothetical protein